MNLLYPHTAFRRITDIPVSFFSAHGLRAAVLDVDNTLATHNAPKPSDGVLDWLETAEKSGLKLLILSNNTGKRVAPFAAQLGLDFVANGVKPLPFGLRRACRALGTAPGETALIGDQLFTDILGGRLAGFYCILVEPIRPEEKGFLKLKRKLERPVLRRYRGEQG